MIPVNYPTPTDYQSTGPDIECAEITQLQEGRTNLPRRKMPKMVKNGKEWSKTFKNGANLCKNVPKSHTFRSLKPSGPDTKWHEMARNGTVLRNTEQNRQAVPMFAVTTAIYCGIAGRTIVMATTGNNAPWSKGLSRQKEHSFLIRFRRRNESSRPTRAPTANSPFNEKSLLTKANCLGSRGSLEIRPETPCWEEGFGQ